MRPKNGKKKSKSSLTKNLNVLIKRKNVYTLIVETFARENFAISRISAIIAMKLRFVKVNLAKICQFSLIAKIHPVKLFTKVSTIKVHQSCFITQKTDQKDLFKIKCILSYNIIIQSLKSYQIYSGALYPFFFWKLFSNMVRQTIVI